MGTRCYDSEVGRWISPDKFRVLTATPTALTDKNLYSYCDNNPVTRADNGGDFWHIVVGAVVGAGESVKAINAVRKTTDALGELAGSVCDAGKSLKHTPNKLGKLGEMKAGRI